MIRVLQVGMGAGYGGIEAFIMNYYRNIDKTNICFDFVDIYGEGFAKTDEIKSLGGSIYTLPCFRRYPIRMVQKMKQILKENKYDIVHLNMMSAANMIPVDVACANDYKPVVIAHSHNSNIPSGNIRKVMNGMNIERLRRKNVVKWACSELAGRWMWGENFDTKNVIFNAIDTKRFCFNEEQRVMLRGQCGFHNRDTVIGFVGRIAEQKNPLFLPDILTELKKISPRYKLLIVGGGEMDQTLRKKIENLQLINDVYFVGKIADASAWYSAMDAFVLPSKFEGLPLVGIEAQACGLPCFVSDGVSEELNITETVQFIPINQGAQIWAEKIHADFSNIKTRNCIFPKEYDITYAVQDLERRYIELYRRRKSDERN